MLLDARARLDMKIKVRVYLLAKESSSVPVLTRLLFDLHGKVGKGILESTRKGDRIGEGGSGRVIAVVVKLSLVLVVGRNHGRGRVYIRVEEQGGSSRVSGTWCWWY